MNTKVVFRRNARRSAFTLIELLLVMVILVVLAAVVVPRFADRGKQAKVSAAKTGINSIETALQMFETDNQRFPSTEEGLVALVQNTGNWPNWKGPYLTKGVPKDPWDRDYIYVYPSAHGNSDFDLASYGDDGQESADDIVNWQVTQ